MFVSELTFATLINGLSVKKFNKDFKKACSMCQLFKLPYFFTQLDISADFWEDLSVDYSLLIFFDKFAYICVCYNKKQSVLNQE